MKVSLLLYNVMFALALPLVFLRVFWRARKEPRYQEDLGQRLGLIPKSEPGGVWVHAVSAGETIAAVALVDELISAGHRVIFSNMTPAGRERAEAAFAQHLENRTLELVYAPYDFAPAVAAFLGRSRPKALIVIDTELWPSLISAARRRSVPVYVVNGRLSERSARGYGRIRLLSHPMFSGLTCVFAQSDSQSERFRQLGAANVVTAGSIKFDAKLPNDFSSRRDELQAKFRGRKVLLAASTHEGEEAIALSAFKQQRVERDLLVLAPRHIHRTESVAALLSEASCHFIKHSTGLPVAAKTDVYLVDTMGELIYFYGVCDSALVGGSLVDVGGHNPMEPAMLGKPICMGPYRRNIADIAQFFSDAGALVTVQNQDELAQFWAKLAQDEHAKNSMAEAAAEVMASHRGALGRVLEIILPALR